MSATEVVGGTRCVATLDAAAIRLRDLNAAAAKASTLISVEARRRAPVATGALMASIAPAYEGSTARVVVAVRYGWPVESGVPSLRMPARPFLADATEATQPVWERFYSGEVDEIMGTVKGA